ncbi:DUF4457 domain-containing protein [Planctomycetota bacterium]
MKCKRRITLLIAALFAINFQMASAQIPATIHSVSSNLKDVAGFDRTAEYVVDESGFSGGTHSINPESTMWLNNGTFAAPNDLEPEITFDLGSLQDIASMKVWNYNESLPNRPELLGRGVGSANILVAGEDLVFSTLISGQAFDIAPGVEDIDFGQTIDLNTSARYVKVDIIGNAGGDNDFVGLSEVQFNAVPEPASLITVLIGLAMLIPSRRRRR